MDVAKIDLSEPLKSVDLWQLSKYAGFQKLPALIKPR